MIKITSNYKKQDVFYIYSSGQTFPTVEGKLISIEISGKELSKLIEKKEIPLCSLDNSSLTWRGRHAGSILKILKELFE